MHEINTFLIIHQISFTFSMTEAFLMRKAVQK